MLSGDICPTDNHKIKDTFNLNVILNQLIVCNNKQFWYIFPKLNIYIQQGDSPHVGQRQIFKNCSKFSSL